MKSTHKSTVTPICQGGDDEPVNVKQYTCMILLTYKQLSPMSQTVSESKVYLLPARVAKVLVSIAYSGIDDSY